MDRAICCFCGEATTSDSFVLALFSAESPDVGQQWWAHPTCVRQAFDEDVLDAGLRPELAKAMELEVTDIDSLDWEYVDPQVVRVLTLARDYFNDDALTVTTREGDDFIMVPGRIDDDDDWARLVAFHERIDELGLTTARVHVVIVPEVREVP